jgi:DNA-binding NarL/FixJ family response regulator
MMNAIRILIVDDHPVVRHGIVSLLSNHADFEVVGEADNVQSAVALVEQQLPDIVLLDVRLTDESGLDLLTQLRDRNTKVLVLTSFDDPEHVRVALQGGAFGFILKNVSDDMLCGAIRTIYQGGRVLSAHITDQMLQQMVATEDGPNANESVFTTEEMRIIRLLVNGASNDQMAADLYMSIASIKRKLRIIFTKLNVQNRAQAAAVIVQRRLIEK